MTELWNVKSVLWEATLTTARIFILAALLSIALSIVIGLARLSAHRWLNWTALVFGEAFRGVSLVVQLFWIFFVLPFFGLTLSASTASVLALGLCFGAYGSEVVRAAMLAVPKGQREAAYALGLTKLAALTHVEFPQAFKIMLPPMGNLLVLVLKSTSVTALITVPELSFTANALNANLGASLAVFAYVMAAYYVMSRAVLWATGSMEHRLRRRASN